MSPAIFGVDEERTVSTSSDAQGNHMTRKLNESDRAAVDLVFDRILSAVNGRSAGSSGGAGGDVVPLTQPISDERLSAVEKILSLLENMPASDPSADLAARTLQHIALHGWPTFAPSAPAPLSDRNHPLA